MSAYVSFYFLRAFGLPRLGSIALLVLPGWVIALHQSAAQTTDVYINVELPVAPTAPKGPCPPQVPPAEFTGPGAAQISDGPSGVHTMVPAGTGGAEHIKIGLLSVRKPLYIIKQQQDYDLARQILAVSSMIFFQNWKSNHIPSYCAQQVQLIVTIPSNSALIADSNVSLLLSNIPMDASNNPTITIKLPTAPSAPVPNPDMTQADLDRQSQLYTQAQAVIAQSEWINQQFVKPAP